MDKTGFFEEAPGAKSYVRLVGFILLWAILLIMLWHELKHRGISDEVYSDGYCYFLIISLSFVFFPKVVQKLIEVLLQIKLGSKVDSIVTTDSTIKKTTLQVDKQTEST